MQLDKSYGKETCQWKGQSKQAIKLIRAIRNLEGGFGIGVSRVLLGYDFFCIGFATPDDEARRNVRSHSSKTERSRWRGGLRFVISVHATVLNRAADVDEVSLNLAPGPTKRTVERAKGKALDAVKPIQLINLLVRAC
jgi:hypothetical protein